MLTCGPPTHSKLLLKTLIAVSLTWFIWNIGVQSGESLSSDYVSSNKKLAENQLVLGANRLAYVISDIFGSSKTVEKNVERLFFQWEGRWTLIKNY